MTQGFFISSSGTGVGKTYTTCLLIRQLLAAGKKAVALKPVISGYDAADDASDTALLRCAQPGITVDAVSPYRFAAPLSPHMAAALEKRTLELSQLLSFCEEPRGADVQLVEGVGGVMVPLNNTHTVLDWMGAQGYPVILIGGTYLGAISHTLTACELVKSRGLILQALIVSESEHGVDLHETCLTYRQFVPYAKHILPLARGAAPDLTGILL